MAITGVPVCYYTQYTEGAIAVTPVKFDDRYWTDLLKRLEDAYFDTLAPWLQQLRNDMEPVAPLPPTDSSQRRAAQRAVEVAAMREEHRNEEEVHRWGRQPPESSRLPITSPPAPVKPQPCRRPPAPVKAPQPFSAVGLSVEQRNVKKLCPELCHDTHFTVWLLCSMQCTPEKSHC